MRIFNITCLALVLSLAVALGACTQPKQPPLPVGNLKLGVAPFSQPMDTGDLFAGYMTEDLSAIEPKVMGELDILFAEVLNQESANSFVPVQSAAACYHQMEDLFAGRQAALRKWSALGRCMGVDLLVVPQVLEYRERDGSDYGVMKPAKVVMDTYVLDVNTESLISRSRYDETQSSLSDNLLETGKFFKRGGKWVQASELAREGMEKAVRELGL